MWPNTDIVSLVIALCCHVLCFRYVVIIGGRKAIHEALVFKSIDFADRPDYYTPSLMNPHAKGQ